MSYHKRRLAKDTELIREGVYDLGKRVEKALRDAVKSLLTRDSALAYSTIIGDNPINRRVEELDQECHYFIARHLPSAGHLRFISSSLRMIIQLERLGDYSVTICREAVQIHVPLTGTFRVVLEDLAESVIRVFSRSLECFRTQDGKMAHETIVEARRAEKSFSTALDLLLEGRTPDLENPDLFGRLIVLSQLERVSDQAKNLCEETLFAVTGERKERRRVRILFVEYQSTGLAAFARAIGESFFSDRAIFFCAAGGKDADGATAFAEFTRQHDLDAELETPTSLDQVHLDVESYDVILSLNSSFGELFETVPFHTVAFDWWLPEGASVEPEEAYRFIRNALDNLVNTMRGNHPALAE